MSDFNVPYICSMSCDRLGFYEDPNYFFLGGGLSGQVFPAHFSAFQACPVYRPIAESDGDRDGERNRAELGKHQYFFIAST